MAPGNGRFGPRRARGTSDRLIQMGRVAFVSMSGLRVREQSLLELGMRLPGLGPRRTAVAELPALGLLTLAGMTDDGWTCSYHDVSSCHEDAVQAVLADQPTLVAISALTASVEDAYRLSASLRRRNVPVVIGGLHATTCADEAMRHCDAVVVGEGEPIWRALLADVRHGEMQPVYRAREPFDLAEAPLPRFDLLGPRLRPRMTLQTSRGCPLACDFCAASRLLGPFRRKPIEAVRRELGAIGQHARRPWLELADDNTFAGPGDHTALLDALAGSGVRYFTESDWRIGEQPALLRNLARSGCVQILMGIESLVFRFPGMGGKQAELRRILDAVRATQEAGIAVNGCFIVGADGETLRSLDRLGRFIDDGPFAEIQLTLQTPFPGTGLRRRLDREGRLIPDRGWSYCTLFDVTYHPDRMSVAALETGFRRLARQVYGAAPNHRRQKLRREILRRRNDHHDADHAATRGRAD